MATDMDGNLQNADWTKKSWDFYGSPAEQARNILTKNGPTPQQSLNAFMARPAAKAMPEAVKAEIRKRGFRV